MKAAFSDANFCLSSSRLTLRKLTSDDATFILELLTDPDFLKQIGDRGVKNVKDAKQYIQQGPQTMYQQYGFGMLLVESRDQNQAMGLCGLLKRPELPLPDLGFAFLPEFRKSGFASEAAQLVLDDAIERCVSEKVLAITSIDNDKSINLLRKLGFEYKKIVDLLNDDDQTKLFELPLTS